MYIQYVGFSLAAFSRIYTFNVIGAQNETREFTVNVPSEMLRSAPLHIQDGPGICFERLKQELDRETIEARAETHLRIGERDVREYLEKQYPRKYPTRDLASAKP